MKATNKLTQIMAAALLVSANAAAIDIDVPHIFKPNTRALAGQVNANFDELKFAIEEAQGVSVAPTPNSSILLSTSDAIVRSTSVVPPRDGHVIFNAQMWFTCTSAAACVARCSVNPGGTTLDTSRFAITSVPNGQYQTMSVAGALPVTANNMLTLNLVCDMFTGVGSIGDPSLTAIYSANTH